MYVSVLVSCMVLLISCCNQWPLYAPWSKQVHTADSQLHPFPKSRIAIMVAKAVQDFYGVCSSLVLGSECVKLTQCSSHRTTITLLFPTRTGNFTRYRFAVYTLWNCATWRWAAGSQSCVIARRLMPLPYPSTGVDCSRG